jgi:hypothetical protein
MDQWSSQSSGTGNQASLLQAQSRCRWLAQQFSAPQRSRRYENARVSERPASRLKYAKMADPL